MWWKIILIHFLWSAVTGRISWTDELMTLGNKVATRGLIHFLRTTSNYKDCKCFIFCLLSFYEKYFNPMLPVDDNKIFTSLRGTITLITPMVSPLPVRKLHRLTYKLKSAWIYLLLAVVLNLHVYAHNTFRTHVS